MNQDGPDPSLKILVAPLDWGLGHATRCIPMVRHLTALGCQVILAGDGRIKTLLKREFPHLQFLDLPGYHIHYSGSRWKMPFKIAAQIPQILQSIKEEHEWLKKAAREQGIDGIISDNRYGLYHDELPTAFMTHQLRIQTPLGSFFSDQLNRLNYSYINKFSFCWIPDHGGSENLSGRLSHSRELPDAPVKYIGPLSRFEAKKPSPGQHILIILSGPEPQRTEFENLVLSEALTSKQKIVLVRGLPGEPETPENKFPPTFQIHNHLPAGELSDKMANASLVISRCGYSTVMDLAAMRKNSILIPTPGQTEQEYLATHLMENNYALCITQEKFRLNQAIDLAGKFLFKSMPEPDDEKTEQALQEFISAIIKQRSHKK